MTDTVEVINLGWGRTGTVSFYKAMQILGYNIYHMNNIGDNYRHNDFWIKVFEGNDSNFEEIFEGLKPLAVCDFPCALQYDKLLQQYPNAKIILQIREPESWYRSYRNTVLKVWPDHPHADQNLPFGIKVLFFLGLSPVKLKLMRFMSKAAWNDNYDKDNIIKSMQNWNQMVIDTFPPERLLIFRVEDGWEPLCRYLDKPVPDVPFPHENDRLFFHRRVGLYNIAGWTIALLLGTIPIGLTFLLLKQRSK